MRKGYKGRKLQGYINCQELGLELGKNKNAYLNRSCLGFKMVTHLQVQEGGTLKQCLHLALPADTILKMSGDGLECDRIQKV